MDECWWQWSDLGGVFRGKAWADVGRGQGGGREGSGKGRYTVWVGHRAVVMTTEPYFSTYCVNQMSVAVKDVERHRLIIGIDFSSS